MPLLVARFVVVVVIVALFLLAVTTFSPSPSVPEPALDPAASLDAPVLIGEVTAINPGWTKNGDGSFTLTATFVVSLLKPTVKVPVEVVILGYPNAYGPATQMELRGEHFRDLLHQRVSVFGYLDTGIYKGKYIAQLVRQL